MEWNNGHYTKTSIKYFYFYFHLLRVNAYNFFSVIGFFAFLFFMIQFFTGIILSVSFIPEPTLIPTIVCYEDTDNNYFDDFLYLHEYITNTIFFLLYVHILRKLYICTLNNIYAWRSGIFITLILYIIVFFGSILTCSNYAEMLLSIILNFFNSINFLIGKIFWFLFTNKQLNSDVLIRFMYIHYFLAFYLLYLLIIHTFDVHFDWKNENTTDGINIKILWYHDIFLAEIFYLNKFSCLIMLAYLFCYNNYTPIFYELFLWGDISFIDDIRYFSISTHWYFKPFMSWLIICHNCLYSVFGLFFFFFLFFFKCNIFFKNKNSNNHNSYFFSNGNYSNNLNFKKYNLYSNTNNNYLFISQHLVNTLKFNYKCRGLYLNKKFNFYFNVLFFFFSCNCIYLFSFLPFSRIYTCIENNIFLIYSYMYVFIYILFLK